MHVAIAMPVFNEVDGIASTISILDEAVARSGVHASLCIQDDCSTDGSARHIEGIAASHLTVSVLVNERNMGHGPTVMTAYVRARDMGADAVIQLDGDGQFCVDDVVRLIAELSRGHDAVLAVRHARTDPAYRRLVTRALRTYLRLLFGTHLPDANSPIRGFSASLLSVLLPIVPRNAVIPNVYLAVLARRHAASCTTFTVSHRPRRGTTAIGSTWRSSGRRILVPRRFLSLLYRALIESLSVRRVIRHGPT